MADETTHPSKAVQVKRSLDFGGGSHLSVTTTTGQAPRIALVSNSTCKDQREHGFAECSLSINMLRAVAEMFEEAVQDES